MALDRELCRNNVEAVVRDAEARDNFVRIDVEDATTTHDTLTLYHDVAASALPATVHLVVGAIVAAVAPEPRIA